MGIAKAAAKFLLNEASRRPFGGRLLTLGRQDIVFSFKTLQKMAREFNIQLCNTEVALSQKPEAAAKGYISDDCFFEASGFSECKTLDYSDFESADVILDLNSSEIDQHLLEAFDVIIDGGTTEHIFHIPNVLNNIYKMVRQNGRVIHMSPSSNHIDHGFYMFSPTLFWDFYAANKFEINKFHMYRATLRYDADPWEISDYTPGCLGRVGVGGLDDGTYGIFCVVTKRPASTGDVVPQQGLYLERWRVAVKPDGQEGIAETSSVSDHSKLRVVAQAVRHFPALYRVLRTVYIIVHRFVRSRRRGLRLKVIARY